jgi:hypothetical protein
MSSLPCATIRSLPAEWLNATDQPPANDTAGQAGSGARTMLQWFAGVFQKWEYPL